MRLVGLSPVGGREHTWIDYWSSTGPVCTVLYRVDMGSVIALHYIQLQLKAQMGYLPRY